MKFQFTLRLVFVTTAIVLGGIISYKVANGLSDFDKALVILLIVLGAGFVAIMVLVFSPHRWRVNVGMVIVSTMAGIYVCEGILWIYAPRSEFPVRSEERPVWWLAEKSGLAADRRTKFEVILDEKKRGQSLLPSSLPSNWIYSNDLASGAEPLMPLGDVSKQQVIVCNESGRWMRPQTDEHGFNNPRGSFNTDVDVLILGDSYAFGWCVDQHETIAGRLRDKGLKTVSLGFAGVGPLYSLAALKEYGAYLRPRNTFFLYFEGNDPIDLMFEKQSSSLMRYLENDQFHQDLIHRQTEIDLLLRKSMVATVQRQISQIEAIKADRRSTEVKLQDITWIDNLIRLPNNFAKLWQLRSRIFTGRWGSRCTSDCFPAEMPIEFFTRILSAMQDRIKSWGGDLHFVYLTDSTRFSFPRTANWRHRQVVLLAVEKLDIPIIDFVPILSKHPDPRGLFPFRRDAHFSGKGYAYIADYLQDAVDNEQPTNSILMR